MTAPEKDFRKRVIAIKSALVSDYESPTSRHSLECGHVERAIIKSKKQHRSALQAKYRWCMECEEHGRLGLGESE